MSSNLKKSNSFSKQLSKSKSTTNLTANNEKSKSKNPNKTSNKDSNKKIQRSVSDKTLSSDKNNLSSDKNNLSSNKNNLSSNKKISSNKSISSPNKINIPQNNNLNSQNNNLNLQNNNLSSSQLINDKINQFKKKEDTDVKALVDRGYQILKNMDDIDEIKQGYHIKLKLKSTSKKKNNKIIQGGFLLKVVKEIVDGKLEFYMQLKSYNKIYRYNLDTVAYIFYKEVTPNAIKIEKLEKKIEYMEKKHKLDYLKLVKLVKLGKI